MANIENKISKLIEYKTNNVYKPKYKFHFSEEQINLNLIIKQYEKTYEIDNYIIKIYLFSVKYPKDAIIPYDSFENFEIMQVEDVEKDKITLINDLLSYKSNSLDDIAQDFENKKNFLIKHGINDLLDIIIKGF